MNKILRRTIAAILATVMAIMSMLISISAESLQSEDDKYIFYDCLTGAKKTIDLSNVDCSVTSYDSNMITPRSIIGTDDRTVVDNTTVSPYKGIAYLSCKKASNTGRSRGTCAAFSNNAVITAAHVVWDSSEKKAAEEYELIFGRNDDDKPYGVVSKQPIGVIIHEKYMENQKAEYDYAILVYDSTISNYRFGFTSSVNEGDAATITGYPRNTSTSEGVNNNDNRQWTASGKVTKVNTRTLVHDIDTTGGQSGSPVYNSSNQIIGIHCGEGTTANAARKIDSSLFDIMKDVRNGTYNFNT